MSRTVMAIACVGVIALAGCGDSGSTTAATTTSSGGSTTTTAGGTTTTSSDATTTTASADPTATVEAQATAALLVASDLGSAFIDAQPDETPSRQPCAAVGAPPIDQQFPPQVRVFSAASDDADQLYFQQGIRVYTDDTESSSVFAAGIEGFNCSDATIDNGDGTTTPIAIGPSTDVAADIGADEAFVWQLSNDQVQGVIVVARLSAAIVTFQFQAAASADTSNAPDTVALAKAGIDKIKSS